MKKSEIVRGIVKPQYDTLECWVHSWPHIEIVSSNAEKLAKLEKVNTESCLISAYCHDLGRIEEERRRQRGDKPLPHALLSIEPTILALQQAGVTGVDFNEIVEAVAVHSYRVYEGQNNIAKVLQDADKMNGFGPYGIIGAFKYFGGVDYVSPEEIQAQRGNRIVLEVLCDKSSAQAEKPVLEKVIRGLGFVLEWYDMLHTKSAKALIKDEYEYTKQVREKLIGMQK
jgi:HD superfamily phosphodiesterase